jgi:hypothetical protein
MFNNFVFCVPVRVHHGSLAKARNNVTRAPTRTRRSSRRRNPMLSFALWLSLDPVQIFGARPGSNRQGRTR